MATKVKMRKIVKTPAKRANTRAVGVNPRYKHVAPAASADEIRLNLGISKKEYQKLKELLVQMQEQKLQLCNPLRHDLSNAPPL